MNNNPKQMRTTQNQRTLITRRYVKRAQENYSDYQAWSKIWELCKKRTYQIARGTREFRERVLSEVGVKISANIGSYNPDKGEFNTWLSRVIKNTAINLSQRESIRSAKSLDSTVETNSETITPLKDRLPNKNEKSKNGIEAYEMRNMLIKAMDELPPGSQRDVIVCRYYFGLTIRQITDHLEMPMGTVKSHLSRGRRYLLYSLNGHI